LLHDHYSLLCYYGPLRHPVRPVLILADLQSRSLSPSHWASRVDSLFLGTHTITSTPVAPDAARVARFAPGLRPSP